MLLIDAQNEFDQNQNPRARRKRSLPKPTRCRPPHTCNALNRARKPVEDPLRRRSLRHCILKSTPEGQHAYTTSGLGNRPVHIHTGQSLGRLGV
jgi:hypothetical protein